MKRKLEIPWDLIIPKLKQDISDADNRRLEEWLSIGTNREVYEELQGVWEKVQAKVMNYTPDVDFYWKEMQHRMEACEKKEHPVRLRTLPRFRQYVAVACVVVAVFLSASLYKIWKFLLSIYFNRKEAERKAIYKQWFERGKANRKASLRPMVWI